MSDDQDELSFSKMREKRGERLPARPSFEPVFATYEFPREKDSHSPQPSAQLIARRKSRWPFDPMRIAAALKLRVRWLIWSACALAVLGLVVGWVASSSQIKVTLILRDVSTKFEAGLQGESYRPRQLAVPTLVDLMTSPELARRVAAKAKPPISEDALKNSVTARQERDTDLVTLTIAGKSRRNLVALAELYAGEAVQMGRELQVAEISRMNQFYKDRIAGAGGEMSRINDELVRFQKESGTIDPEAESLAYTKQLSELLSKADSARIELEMADMQVAGLQAELTRQNPLAQKIEAAKSKLADLLGRLTEQHPSVENQRQQIASLERQLAAAGTNNFSTAGYSENSMSSTLYMRMIELKSHKATLEKQLQAFDSLKQSLQDKVTGISRKGLAFAVIKAKLDSQRNSLSLLANRQREAQLYEENAQGYFRLFAQPGMNDVDMKQRWVKAFNFGLVGFILGVFGAAFVVAAKEISDDRLKTAADVERVADLPVLASLGDLNSMTLAQREQWAFRTWTALSSQLSASANHGMVCGFISSTNGEGRSTWIKLLADAAARRGLRVLTVAAQSPSADSEKQSGKAATPSETERKDESTVQETILTPQVLISPNDVARQFAAQNAPAVAHVPLDGWVWNLERRKQWQGAMAQWRAIDNLVLFVELPPASAPEAVLLAENLPQLIWLADSGRSRTRETRRQLETLRHAKCRLAGAVLNHEPESVLNL